MKRSISVRVALMLVLCLLALTFLVSCRGGKIDESGSCTVVIADGENTAVFEVPLEELAGGNEIGRAHV